MKRKADKLEDITMEEESETLPEDAKMRLVAQEIKFAKVLAGNNPFKRDKALKNFRKWLNLRSKSSFPFTEDDFLRLWKGLFYCMWMSDKPLVQEQLAEDLANLVHCFNTPEMGIHFFGAFMKSMCLEWFGIDQWRIDKFMMLVRRCTRQTIVLLKNNNWDKHLIDEFIHQISNTVLNYVKTTASLIMHFADLYIEEIAKISEGNIPPETVSGLMKPFIIFVGESSDSRIIYHIATSVFYALLAQSDIGREFDTKFHIWKRAGFPCKDIDNLEIKEEYIENSDSENAEDDNENVNEAKSLDPRAGRVNVDMPEIEFDVELILNMFNELMYKPKTMKLNRNIMKRIIGKYQKYSENIYPLGMKTAPQFGDEKYKLPNIDEKAMKLYEFEKKLYADNSKLKHMNKKQRKKWIKESYEKKVEVNEPEVNDQLEMEKQEKEISLNTTGNGWVEEDNDTEINGYTGGNFVLLKSPHGNNSEHSDIVLNGNNSNSDSTDDNKILKKHQKKLLKSKPELNGSILEETLNNSNKKIKKLKTSPASHNGSVKTLKKRNSIDNPESAKKNKLNKVKDEWDEELAEGEVEYFIPSRKLKLQQANEENEETEIIITPRKYINPFAKINAKTPINKIKGKNSKNLENETQSKSSEKRVKIALNKNSSQDTDEYHNQLLCSPLVPYDSAKKPTKGLLKPNLMPSPINPFYRKKLSLNFDGMV